MSSERKPTCAPSVLILLAVLLPALGAAQEPPELFVLVTSPDAQTLGMAFIWAAQAVQGGTRARVLLCGPAGDLALKASASPPLKPRGVTPKQMLKELIAKNVPVQVCALYLPNGGHQADDLIEGVTAAQPAAISNMMLTDGVRDFTF